MSIRLSFIVPVRNDAVRLQRCLASIAADRPAVPFEIIVADNGSTDDTAAVAERAGATVVSLPDRAVSRVRNDAVALAKGDLLGFVDADQELEHGWSQACLATFADPAIVAAGSDYQAPSNGSWVTAIYDSFRNHAPGNRPTTWLPSGNLVVRRDVFAAVGGFDTGLESCEDVDLCQRLTQVGTLLHVDAMRSVHHGDPTSLKALFFSELWRGRDNLRVSLRVPLTLRSAPSVIVPMIGLLLLAIIAAGLLSLPFRAGGLPWVVSAAMGFVGLAALRAARLFARLPPSRRNGLGAGQSLVVSVTYELARSLALIVRAGHDLRRRH